MGWGAGNLWKMGQSNRTVQRCAGHESSGALGPDEKAPTHQGSLPLLLADLELGPWISGCFRGSGVGQVQGVRALRSTGQGVFSDSCSLAGNLMEIR